MAPKTNSMETTDDIKKVYLCGAGGHTKSVIDNLHRNGYTIVAVADIYSHNTQVYGVPIVYHETGLSPMIISIGNNSTRKRLAENLDCEFISSIDPTAIVSETAQIGEGTVVMNGAIVEADCKVGKHCIINSGSTVAHECKIADYVHVAVGATLCGNVTVGEGSFIAAGAVIIPGIKIGKWCIVGAGTTITRDVPDNTKIFDRRDKVTTIIENL